ncbi:MAG: phosphomannomutase/phosphoglucomutase [Planctomycetes bacterium]|nr:phosphomannomutase/phosphoglucomutase [Planctomycetota bacterium]
MGIFKAYDIRGKYPSELDEPKAYIIGRAIARYFKVKSIAIGRDVRLSSDSMRDALVKGLTDEQVAVTDIGVATTPMSYFASAVYGFPAMVMVTASHNPPEYNGFKICRENAIALSEKTGLLDIKRIADEISLQYKYAPAKTKTALLDIKADYKKLILNLVKIPKPVKIVVDTANGAVGPVFEEIFSKAEFAYTALYFKPDGRFPNHEPNPMNDENMVDIKKAILKNKADFGVAFDGDGDRCMFLDEKAERIPSDMVSALIAREMIAAEPGAGIVYDLRSSWAVKEEIVKAGGKPIRERVGHAFIKEMMRKYNSPFAGELSGHYYFRQSYPSPKGVGTVYWFADSGIVAFVNFINAVTRIGKPVSEIIKPFKRYFASGEQNFEVKDKDAVMEKITVEFKDASLKDKLDGVTIEYPDWWLNLRPSNTEPLLRLNLEAKTKDKLDKITDRLVKIIKEG